jgi:ABC-type lipoprotein release transport system permease subunit
MRYKNLIETKLEQMENALNVLHSLLSQNAPIYQIQQWFELQKEKLDEIKTLLNSETQN